MSADRQNCPADRTATAVGASCRPDPAIMLMPAGIVTFGAAARPAECLMGLQSATATAVQMAADAARLAGVLIVLGCGLCRRALQAGASLPSHR